MEGLGYLWVSNYGRNLTGAPRATYDKDGGDSHRGWTYPLGDRKPDILQFGSNGVVGGWHPVDVNAFRGSREQLAAIFNRNPAPKKEQEVTPEQARRIEEKLDKIIADQNTILSQLGFNGGKWSGFKQGGHRTAYDLQAAIAAKLDVPGTYDQMDVLKAKKEI